jgi:hypothetical protein
MEPASLQARLRTWMEGAPGVFDCAPLTDGVRLTETATGKSLVLPAEAVRDVETRTNAQTGRAYLVLDREDRQPLALADAGFVFALDTRSTGPLPSAPPVMSFRDFRRLYEHLRHRVEQPDGRREALDVLMILIASLDGARAAGLATEVEEGELDAVLRRLEAGS